MALADMDKVSLLAELRLLEGQKLQVIEGDIAALGPNVDAVVHPTSESMHPSGMVGSALLKVGGDSFKAAIDGHIKENGSLDLAAAAITGGGALGTRNVIHVHSPSYKAQNSMDLLEKAVVSCLNAAKDHGQITTLAFPSIGSGNNGFPKVDAARRIMRTLKEYFSVRVTCVEHIFFVLHDAESLKIYKTELGRLQMNDDESDID